MGCWLSVIFALLTSTRREIASKGKIFSPLPLSTHILIKNHLFLAQLYTLNEAIFKREFSTALEPYLVLGQRHWRNSSSLWTLLEPSSHVQTRTSLLHGDWL